MSSAFRFRKVDLIFVVAALAVVVGVTMLPTPRDRNPMIPADADHRTLTGEKDCVNCHVPKGSQPLPVKHPKRQDCFRCHAKQ
jgi:doubled CXXCH motif protein